MPSIPRQLALPGFKPCPRCKRLRAHSEYYTHKQRRDGLQTYCVACQNANPRPKYRGFKICSRCHESLPLEFFGKTSRAPSFVESACKQCKRPADLANARRRAAEGGECVQEKFCPHCGQTRPAAAFYRYSLARDGLGRWCSECQKAYGRERRRGGGARIKALDRRNYRRNGDHNREAAKLRAHMRRVAGGAFTAEEWRNLCSRYDGRCVACGALGALTIDHVVPVSWGGTNNIENIQPLCWACNSAKKNYHATDYRW